MRIGTGTPLRALILGLALGVTGTSAHASIDEECVGKTQTFDDEGQQNFLLNFFALATTFSPLHAPVPGPAGSGGVDIEIAVIPPLSCEQRLVLGSSKTEDTNKAPAAPRPRVSFVLPAIGKLQPYGSFGYVPPVEEPDKIALVVAGGDIPIAQQAYFPTWGYPDCCIMKEVILPNNWRPIEEELSR